MTKQSLGIIGLGAFGRFMAQHLAPFFDLAGYDPDIGSTALVDIAGFKTGALEEAASSGIVVLAVPVQKLESVLWDITSLIKPQTLVLDVSSVKIKPATLMRSILPQHADIVGTHPLFGPQSGRGGIEGLNIVVSDIQGDRGSCVAEFLQQKLKLNVHSATPDEHDRELAYVQGLTHLLAKVIVAMDLPKFRFTTRTYDYMEQMVEMVRYDSEELFKAIERENPFSAEAKKAFFTAARNLEDRLMKD